MGFLIRFLFKIIKFFAYVMFLGVPAVIIILLCYGYLNDIRYTNGFSQYIETILSSSENPGVMVWGLILNFPFSDILNNVSQGLGDLIDFSEIISIRGNIVEQGVVRSNIFINLVQLSLAQFVMFGVTRFNGLLQKIWKDKTFKFAYWYVTIFWTIVAFSVSATIIKFMYLVFDPQQLKVAYLMVMLIAFFLHALFLAKGKGFSRIAFSAVYLALDMIFFFIQAVLIWLMGTSMINMFDGSFINALLPCFIVYLVFLMIKESITKTLLSAMCVTSK